MNFLKNLKNFGKIVVPLMINPQKLQLSNCEIILKLENMAKEKLGEKLNV